MKPSVAGIALILSFLGCVVLAQDDKPSGPIIELPKFVVTDNRELPPPESWRYATIPGFEVLTNASDKATQRLIRDFDMFRQALVQVWPVPNRSGQTATLIICGRGNKFDAFIPDGKTVVDAGFVSLFRQDNKGHATIIIDLQATTLNVLNVDDSNDAATGTDSGMISVEHDKQLYREYVRYLLSRTEPRLPAWFEEGLSQIIMRMQFDRRWIQFAKLEEPNTVSAQAAMNMQLNQLAADAGAGDDFSLPGAPAEDRDFNTALQRKALVPLEKFFAVQHDSPEATNALGNNRWAKQAYAFVHMCLYGYKGKYQKQFMTFLQRSAREPVTEAMFQECFNKTYKQMLMEIRSYIDFTVYESKEYTAKKDVIIPPPPLALRDATQSEVGRIKGQALVLCGHPKAARAELIAPYVRGERDPALLAALGLYDRENGEPERGRKLLEAAYTYKAKSPEAEVELARLRYADALAKPAGANGQFSAAQVADIIGPLQLVRRQPPLLSGVYEVAADTWVHGSAKLTKDEVGMLIEGAQLFPTHLKLIYQAAMFAGEAGELRAAHALADHGIKYGPDPSVKKRFEELKAKLPPAPASAEAEASSAPAPMPAAAGKKK